MLRPELDHLSGIDRTRIVMPDNVTMRVGRLEKPEPWPVELIEAIRQSLPLDRIQQYPDFPPFYARIAEFIGVSEDQIVVGAGIEEFIRTLMAGCFGRKMAVLWPTCAMIDVYARSFQVDLNRIVTDPFRPPTILDVVDHIERDTSLVMLANPGQPPGEVPPASRLWAIDAAPKGGHSPAQKHGGGCDLGRGSGLYDQQQLWRGRGASGCSSMRDRSRVNGLGYRDP